MDKNTIFAKSKKQLFMRKRIRVSKDNSRSFVKKIEIKSPKKQATKVISTAHGENKSPYRSPKKQALKIISTAHGERKSKYNVQKKQDSGLIRLNKFIANSGVCSRREADVLIESGVVSVNDKVITEMGYKVLASDTVRYDGKLLKGEKKVYVLLNKPKGFITTTDDPRERKTVMELVRNACKERIYPVGRLDRNTSGLLLFTNDGEMTKRLTHPAFGAKKLYHVELNKPVTKRDMEALIKGLELEDGFCAFDDVQYSEVGESKKVVGVELHSGKNRIVRRMFETLGYEVDRLDRVAFAGLTKKNLPRGHWRLLTDTEISLLSIVPKSKK
jgi:23S rRNA pseudouridine2605 synthase